MIGRLITGLLVLLSATGMAQLVDSDQVVTIPVVVHVVYANSTQNISDAQIESQIKVLNEDFRRTNVDKINTPSDFENVAADSKIEFKLATIDPDGAASTGITRTSTTKTQFVNDQITNSATGGVNSWGANYLNIWVSNLPDGLAGWANNSATDSAVQGVILDHAFFGTNGTVKSPYHLGRTATHEIGHWLGLKHLEGIGSCDNDDGIDDTPNQESSISGNTTTHTSCGSADMVSNFMQLGDDEILNLFTTGQKEVMRAMLFENYQALLQNGKRIVGLSEQINASSFEVYPNPVTENHFHLTHALPLDIDLHLTSLLGETLDVSLLKISELEYEIRNPLSPGLYLLSFTSENKYYQTKINLRF